MEDDLVTLIGAILVESELPISQVEFLEDTIELLYENGRQIKITIKEVPCVSEALCTQHNTLQQ
jgi:hypothetical protein